MPDDLSRPRYSPLARFAMARAGTDPEAMRLALSHRTECVCVHCERFRVYLRVKDTVDAWAMFQATDFAPPE